ncbi:family 78 glycoside hydrolase catalytic domain [Bacillus sinesaloumensis]|uniref:family 78 glycoside hydrolase catalytic domain n=1 Tax=Litchfieldia sinesaloumensis TaxID=1926280 RepID=UPI000988613A|nr:family 78 glycoside hydrolase catalytic domain [Bacillus sinesaloumensis]
MIISMLWDASWIWNEIPEYTPNIYNEFRKTFHVKYKTNVTSAKISISANQEYILYINEKKIGRGPSPSDNNWKYYDTYDVTAYIIEGQENIVSILVYNFGTKEIVTQQYQGPGGVIAQLEIDTDNEPIVISTDSSWKCRQSPRWFQEVSRQHNWNGYKEVYLAENEDGWEKADYDDTAWDNSQIIAKAEDKESAWPRLIPREIPFLHKEKIFPSTIFSKEGNLGTISIEQPNLENSVISVDASVPGSMPALVYDFEKEVVGYMQLEILAPKGGVVQLHYGESLDLTLYDTIILKEGKNFFNPFGRRAFRYLKVTVQATPEPITIKKVNLEFVHYPFEKEGTFETSDSLLNQIWEIGKYTTKVNSQDHLEDTPLRERALWVVDEIVMGKVIYNVFGDHVLLRKSLLQGARIQNEDGSIPGTGPERNDMMLPDFCAHWLFGVTDYLKYTNDIVFVEELWGTIERLLEWFRLHETEEGLFTISGNNSYWCFIDWAEYIDRRDKVTALSCFYYKVLKSVSALARIIRKEEESQKWEEKADKLKKQIRTTMWSNESNAFVDCVVGNKLSENITYQTNFIAMWTGIMSGKEAKFFIEEYFLKGKAPEIKGPFFYHFVLEELFSRNYTKEALETIRGYWGEMIARGATTWWETFEPSKPHCTVPSAFQGHTPTYLHDHIPVSYCHGWGAGPTYLMTQHILGVDIFELGKKLVKLKPHTAYLDWAKGTIPTRWGEIDVEWRKKEDGRIHYQLHIPESIHWIAEFDETMDVQINGVQVGLEIGNSN